MAEETSGEGFEAVKRTFSYQKKEARRQMAEPSPTLLDTFEEPATHGRPDPTYLNSIEKGGQKP